MSAYVHAARRLVSNSNTLNADTLVGGAALVEFVSLP